MANRHHPLGKSYLIIPEDLARALEFEEKAPPLIRGRVKADHISGAGHKPFSDEIEELALLPADGLVGDG